MHIYCKINTFHWFYHTVCIFVSITYRVYSSFSCVVGSYELLSILLNNHHDRTQCVRFWDFQTFYLLLHCSGVILYSCFPCTLLFAWVSKRTQHASAHVSVKIYIGNQHLPPSSNIHHTSMVPGRCFFLNWALVSLSFSFIMATCMGGGSHTDTDKERRKMWGMRTGWGRGTVGGDVIH